MEKITQKPSLLSLRRLPFHTWRQAKRVYSFRMRRLLLVFLWSVAIAFVSGGVACLLIALLGYVPFSFSAILLLGGGYYLYFGKKVFTPIQHSLEPRANRMEDKQAYRVAVSQIYIPKPKKNKKIRLIFFLFGFIVSALFCFELFSDDWPGEKASDMSGEQPATVDVSPEPAREPPQTVDVPPDVGSAE
jgi:hypothetical protein